MKQHMVETNALKQKGVKSEALEGKNDVLFIDDKWNRVCTPNNSERMESLIFWNKTGPEDKPSWDKQVSDYSHCLCCCL